ncbi:MAG: protein of unknown function DUF1073 [Caudoviricetes sp.]|nr:MAG: protein of unknown function DUF1073 [Caudoviricetes sp.]
MADNEHPVDNPKLNAAVAHVRSLIANKSARAIENARSNLLHAGMGSDNKRTKAWCEYGFPDHIDGDMLENMWRRGGVAYGAVSKLVSNCWKTNPTVVEGGEENTATKESAIEAQFAKWAKDHRLWKAFRRADELRLVRRFSALILFYADDLKDWAKPVPKGKPLVEVRAVSSKALKIGETDSATGRPLYWNYTETTIQGAAAGVKQIHPDRIFILGDYANDALGWLEPVYNDLVSLEKLCGGGGESFLKNASRQLAMEFDKDVDLAAIAQAHGVPLQELQEVFQEVAQDLNRGNDTVVAIQGGRVTPLVSAVPDPSPIYNTNLQNIAAGVDIPAKIIVGSQTGERASTEDREYFNARCQARRVSELTDEIQDFLAKIGAAGAFEFPAEITIAWDDLNESSRGDKLGNAKLMAEINEKAIDPADQPFSKNEVRVEAGFEPDGEDGDE